MSETPESVEILAPEILRLVDGDVRVEQICTGFTFSEGPIWNQPEACLYFSDMPNDIRPRWSENTGVVEVRNPSNKCNGMTYDGAGNLYVCEHGTSTLVRETPEGERHVLATHWQGKELNSPNDVVVRSDNTVYFTDPTRGPNGRTWMRGRVRRGCRGRRRTGARRRGTEPKRARALALQPTSGTPLFPAHETSSQGSHEDDIVSSFVRFELP